MREWITVEEIDSEGPRIVGISAAIARELLEAWCMTQLLWVSFESANALALWEQVTRHVRGYLMTLWITGMLRGGSAKESFIVKCDHTTMTQAEIRAGYLICQVGMAPVKSSEFIYCRIRIKLKASEHTTRHSLEGKLTLL